MTSQKREKIVQISLDEIIDGTRQQFMERLLTELPKYDLEELPIVLSYRVLAFDGVFLNLLVEGQPYEA